MLLIMILASLVPGILWVWFFRSQDRFEQEPIGLLAKTFVFGAVAVIPAALFEFPFRNLVGPGASLFTQAWVAFLVVGFGEELFKLLAVFLAVYRDPEFNEPVDGIIYGITAALGFSVVENILYTASFGLAIAPIRAVVASLAHASFSGLLGFYLGRAKFSEEPEKLVVYGLLVATVWHGLYDFILLSGLVSPIIALVMIAGLYWWLRRKIDEALVLSPFYDGSPDG